MRRFSQEEVRGYNGRNRNPAYIAYRGKVYDVTSLLINGEHMGCIAGNDLTDILPMMSHEDKVIDEFAVVGEMDE
ncbi:MAG: hypothetical protein M0Z31_06285 [Clostridia bacterium]|nr:hypothetical protein [Clostridia bacterium]